MSAEFFLHKSSPTYIHPENADVMAIGHFMAQNLRQAPPIPPPPKHTFEISEGESVEIEKIVAAEKKEGQIYYKVKWVKYTWEAEESIQHLPHLIDGYWREHFYQNINQAAIDTTGINLVANEADFQARNKTTVVNTTSDAGKQAAETFAEKLTSPITTHSLTASTSAQVSNHDNVILEFTLHQQQDPKTTEAFQNRLNLAQEKKPRRVQPLERKYICQICNKAFDRNTSLTRHLLTHTREKPFKCQLCDKAFSQNAHLKRHILIHIGQKSYQCNKCGKMFIEKGGLARHEATHRKEKPFICNQCGKAFVLNEYLQRHLFLHTGQKPYQCNECGRLFADGSSWRAHKLTHNKEKKYKCHICQKMLKCKRNFKKHVEAHSDEKDSKHQCEICSTRFPNKKSLKDHYKNMSKEHRCTVCRFYMESKEIFDTHMTTHDPNSENYNPNPKLYAIDDDDIGRSISTDNSSGNNNKDDNNDENMKSDGESIDQNDSDETFNEMLDQAQHSTEVSDTHHAVVSTESDVPSSFTTLILKPENIEQHSTVDPNDSPETGNEEEIDDEVDMDSENQQMVEQPNTLNLQQNNTILVNPSMPLSTPTLNIPGITSNVMGSGSTAVVNSNLNSVLAAISMTTGAINATDIIMKNSHSNTAITATHINTNAVAPASNLTLPATGVPVIMQGVVPQPVVNTSNLQSDADIANAVIAATRFAAANASVNQTPSAQSAIVNIAQNMNSDTTQVAIDPNRQATEAEVEKTIILITQSTEDDNITNQIN